MDRAALLVVRETRSLGDALTLLLESVGHTVLAVDSPEGAAHLLGQARGRRVRVVVVACNERDCRSVAEPVPAFGSRPILVVGSRPSLVLPGLAGNIVRVGLPLDTSRFLDLVSSMARSAGSAPAALGLPGAEPN